MAFLLFPFSFFCTNILTPDPTIHFIPFAHTIIIHFVHSSRRACSSHSYNTHKYITHSSSISIQLFDTDNVVNQNALDYMFTTEGHLIKIDPSFRVKPWEKEFDDDAWCEEKMSKAVARQNESFIGHSVSLRVYVLLASHSHTHTHILTVFDVPQH